MSAVPADLTISCRWILPMTAADEALENHTLVVRDGRILDVLPSAHVAGRYDATLHVERPEHLLLPGLVDAHAGVGPLPGCSAGTVDLGRAALARVAQMLRAGTTCFCGVGDHPDVAARVAAEQGMRALIGMPIAAAATPWAGSPAEYLTRALAFRDEYRGHPFIATAFAAHAAASLPDETLARIATLADELEAGILVTLHESEAAIAESLELHGLRPLARLHALGMLTPALTAVQMVRVDAAEIALAGRTGIAVTLCPDSALRAGHGLPPIDAWTAAASRLGLGSGASPSAAAPNLWNDLRLATLFAAAPAGRPPDAAARNALAMATRGGAAALGLESEIGTLEPGKWADLCCIDARGPAMAGPASVSPREAPAQWLLNAGRDTVSDVWVAGRHLLNAGEFTRLDWPRLAARLHAPAGQSIDGETHADSR